MADMSKVKLPDNSIYNLRDNRFIYEKSVEAAQIASFSDGANDIPLKELSLSINPTQSGSGDPYPAGGGKNKCDAQNNIVIPSSGGNIGDQPCVIPAGTYTYSWTSSNTAAISLSVYNGTTLIDSFASPVSYQGRASLTFTISESATKIRCYYNYATTVTNIMVEAGSSMTDYAPYSNIRPITGVSSVNVTRTGKNIIPNNAISHPVPNNLYAWRDGTGTTLKAGTYTVSCSVSVNGLYVNQYGGGGTLFTKYNSTFITFTLDEDTSGINLNLYLVNGDLTNAKIQLEVGNSATDIEPYTGNTYTIQLGDTYYGGELDIDEDGNVKFRGDWVKRTLDDSSKWETSTGTQDYRYRVDYSDRLKTSSSYDNLLCSLFLAVNSENTNYIRWTASTSNQLGVKDQQGNLSLQILQDLTTQGKFEIAYKLATPIEIDLTPTQINSLLGTNNIWHDANGTTACTYRVNTPLVDAIKDISPEVTIDDSKTVTDQTWSSSKIASEISSATAGVIDDTTTDTDTTWSSSKISTELATKTEVDDTTASATKTYSSNKIEDIIAAITPRTGTVTDQAVATFSDGADNVPMKSVTLSINPLQEGSGDPYPAGGGKNKLPPFTNGTYTQNSIKAVVKDGLITVTGQKDTASGINLTLPLSKTFTLKQNDYLHIRNSNSNASITLSFAGAGWSPAFASTNRIIQYTGVDASVTGVTIYFAGTVTEEQNFTFQPSLEVGSAVTDWTPYENIRPISGVSSVNVARTGKNLSPTQPINYTATNYGVILFWVKAGTYTASYTGGNCQFYVRTSTPTDTTITSGTEISHSTTYRNDYTFTVPSDGYYKVQLYRSSGSPWSAVDAPTNFQIEIGNQPSSYEPYNGNIYTISLGDTYYGATLDVVRGVLTVTHKFIKPTTNFTLQNGVFVSSVISDIKKSETTSETNNIIKACNMFKPSGVRYRDSVKNGMIAKVVGNNTQIACYSNTFTDVDDFNDRVISQGLLEICYELATPIEIDLTLTQINSLLGSNNIWHDGNGNISCEYYKTGCEPIARLIESYTDKPTFFNGTLFN